MTPKLNDFKGKTFFTRRHSSSVNEQLKGYECKCSAWVRVEKRKRQMERQSKTERERRGGEDKKKEKGKLSSL